MTSGVTWDIHSDFQYLHEVARGLHTAAFVGKSLSNSAVQNSYKDQLGTLDTSSKNLVNSITDDVIKYDDKINVFE